MQRHSISPRPNWQETVESQGLVFHTHTSRTHTPERNRYWDESACYSFTAAEIDSLETATNRLHEMCLAAAQHVIEQDRFAELHIPAGAAAMIRVAWAEEPPAIYGRFDLAYDGTHIKLLEYNADTPTSLLEAAVVQWYWLQDIFPQADQFNSLHERLVARWRELAHRLADRLYFAHMDNAEDRMTVTYLRDTAEQAGISTEAIAVNRIGWNGRCFTDTEERQIKSCFKLYPWEWLTCEKFGAYLPKADMQWIEPVWKMVLSNKGILPILWELFPGHEYLLEAHSGSPGGMRRYVKKPLLSREGQNVSLITETEKPSPDGEHEEGFIFQELASIPSFKGNYPVLGSWVIGGEAGGMGIRESSTPITTNLSRFVPHMFED